MKIKLTVKPVHYWTGNDFVKYFKSKYSQLYNKEYEQLTETDFAKDALQMRKIVSIFIKKNRPKELVLNFIDWIFIEYPKRTDLTDPLSVSFLQYWITDYLKEPVELKKKEKRKTKEDIEQDTYSPEMKKWLEEQRKTYKAPKPEDYRVNR